LKQVWGGKFSIFGDECGKRRWPIFIKKKGTRRHARALKRPEGDLLQKKGGRKSGCTREMLLKTENQKGLKVAGGILVRQKVFSQHELTTKEGRRGGARSPRGGGKGGESQPSAGGLSRRKNAFSMPISQKGDLDKAEKERVKGDPS